MVNPAARDDPSSPLFGMPILNADQAAHVVFMKRSMRPGFSGVDNALLYDPRTVLLFGDAKDSLTKLVTRGAGGLRPDPGARRPLTGQDERLPVHSARIVGVATGCAGVCHALARWGCAGRAVGGRPSSQGPRGGGVLAGWP